MADMKDTYEDRMEMRMLDAQIEADEEQLPGQMALFDERTGD